MDLTGTMTPTSSVYQHAFVRVVEDLTHRYPTVPVNDVVELVAARRAELEAANHHPEYIPSLVENAVSDELHVRVAPVEMPHAG